MAILIKEEINTTQTQQLPLKHVDIQTNNSSKVYQHNLTATYTLTKLYYLKLYYQPNTFVQI